MAHRDLTSTFTTVGLMAVLVLTLPACSTVMTPPELTEAAVREISEDAVGSYQDAFDSQGWDAFCEEFSANLDLCEGDAETATDLQGAVNVDSVVITIESITPTLLKVLFDGEYTSGVGFHSETQGLVGDDRVVLLNAAFWSPRVMSFPGDGSTSEPAPALTPTP